MIWTFQLSKWNCNACRTNMKMVPFNYFDLLIFQLETTELLWEGIWHILVPQFKTNEKCFIFPIQYLKKLVNLKFKNLIISTVQYFYFIIRLQLIIDYWYILLWTIIYSFSKFQRAHSQFFRHPVWHLNKSIYTSLLLKTLYITNPILACLVLLLLL